MKLKKIEESLQKIDLQLTQTQLQQFLDYYEILIEVNQVMNLTAITDFDEVLQKHFIDSLSLKNIMDLSRPLDIIDVGTGAGFPGIPLKIVYPNLKIVLMDSLNKRINFLDNVISKLKLVDIKTIHARAEDLGRNPEYREQFDCCVSRAVANLSTLSEYCMPFVKPEGYFIPYKSGNITEELNASKHAIHLLSGSLEQTETFTLPDSDMTRSLLKIRKTTSISKKYPRKAGKPSKEPLK